MDTSPEAMSAMNMGTKNGLIRCGPRSSMMRACSSNVRIPPIPLPMITPIRSRWRRAHWQVRAASGRACWAPARANGANRSVRRTSFRSRYCSGSKPFTSHAKRTSKSSVTSNCVIGPAPLLPSSKAFHVVGTSLPTGVTSPTPVTTTRCPHRLRVCIPCLRDRSTRYGRPPPLSLARALVLLQVTDRVADGLELLGLLIRDLDAELLLERHDQLHRIQRISAEILDEGRFGRHLLGLHPQLVDNDLLDLRLDAVRHDVPRRWGLHAHAAIDHDHLARNVTRARTCEKPYDPGHVLRGPESPERDPSGQLLPHGRREGRRHLGVDVTGRHRIAQYPAGRQFLRHRLGEPDEPGLRRRVVGLALVAHESYDARHVDDAAAAAAHHAACDGPDRVEGASQVRVQDPVPVLVAQADQEVVLRDPRIVDEHIHRPQVRFHSLDQGIDGSGLAHIAPVTPVPPPRKRGSGRDRVTFAPSDHSHPRAGAREFLRTPPTKTPRAASGPADLAGELPSRFLAVVRHAPMSASTSFAVPTVCARLVPSIRLSSPLSTEP